MRSFNMYSWKWHTVEWAEEDLAVVVMVVVVAVSVAWKCAQLQERDIWSFAQDYNTWQTSRDTTPRLIDWPKW